MQLFILNVEQCDQFHDLSEQSFVIFFSVEVNDLFEHLMPQNASITLLYFLGKACQGGGQLGQLVRNFLVSGFACLNDLFCPLAGDFGEELLTIFALLVLGQLLTELLDEEAA